MTVGRTKNGHIKRGYRLTRGGKVVKASSSRKRRRRRSR